MFGLTSTSNVFVVIALVLEKDLTSFHTNTPTPHVANNPEKRPQ